MVQRQSVVNVIPVSAVAFACTSFKSGVAAALAACVAAGTAAVGCCFYVCAFVVVQVSIVCRAIG